MKMGHLSEKQLRFSIFQSYETLRKWKIAYEAGGLDALQSKKKGRPSMKKNKNKRKNQHQLKVQSKHYKRK